MKQQHITLRGFAGFREAGKPQTDVPSVLSTFERGVRTSEQSTEMMKQPGRWEQHRSERENTRCCQH
jgi:hypothetical protein